MTDYQKELAKRLKLSPITPGTYSPSNDMKRENHIGIMSGDKLFMLIGPSDCETSIAESHALAANPDVQHIAKLSNYEAPLSVTQISGDAINWTEEMPCVIESMSGVEEFKNTDGVLIWAFPNETTQALATSFCVVTSIARTYDSNCPDMGDANKLSQLASATH